MPESQTRAFISTKAIFEGTPRRIYEGNQEEYNKIYELKDTT